MSVGWRARRIAIQIHAYRLWAAGTFVPSLNLSFSRNASRKILPFLPVPAYALVETQRDSSHAHAEKARLLLIFRSRRHRGRLGWRWVVPFGSTALARAFTRVTSEESQRHTTRRRAIRQNSTFSSLKSCWQSQVKLEGRAGTTTC